MKSLVPWAWAWFVAVSGVVFIVVESLDDEASSVTFGLVGLLLTLLFTFLGVLIAVRQPGNRIAWLLMAVGFGLLLAGMLIQLVGTEPNDPGFVDLAALVVDAWVGLNMIFFPLVLITYLFPTGRFFTRRQAWVGWFGAIMVLASLLIALSVVEIGPAFQNPDDAWTIPNPVGFLPPVALDAVMTFWGQGLIVLAFGGVWSLVNRYRKSSEVVKAQIKWMLLASMTLVVGFVLIVTTDTDSTISGLLTAFAFASIPVSITIAITRYRLFDIDRIISRTLTYILVVAILGAVYVGIVTLTTAIVASQSMLAVAVSTLAVAALFNPLRKRIRNAIDRKFNRSGYEPEVVSQRLASELGGSMDTEEIVQAWSDTAVESLQPEAVAIWIDHNYTTPQADLVRP